MAQKQDKKPLSKKARIIITCSCVTCGVLIGGGSGFLLGYLLKTPTVNLADVNINDIEDSETAGSISLLDRYQACVNEGKDPTQEFELYELANIALKKFSASEHSVTYGYGKVLTAVNLDIRNCTIRNGNQYMEESLSKSAAGAIMNVVVAQRDIQVGTADADSVTSYLGNIESDVEQPDWSKATTNNYSVADYTKKFGKSVDTPSVYIISSKTVLTDEVTQTDPETGAVKTGQSSISKVDGGYTLYMDLHTTYAVARYYYRMTNLSGSNVSLFNYIHLTYHLDNDFNLISSRVEESYVAGMGNIKASVEGSLNTYFFADHDDFSIPDINTNITYPKEGELYA